MAAGQSACPPTVSTAAALNIVIGHKSSMTQSPMRRLVWRTWVTSRGRRNEPVEAVTFGR